jgi:hypothetical protein
VTPRLSATAFLTAVLAFGLPFGTVSSCDGEQVQFTGVQLATFDVPPDPGQGGTLHQDVERNGSLPAIAVLVISVLGLGIALAGRRGAGICASLGLVFMQLLAWAILLTSDGGSDLYIGFWLTLVSLAAAAILHLVLLLRERKRLGRSVWRPALGRVTLVLLPTLGPIVVALVAAAAGGG